MEMNNKVDFPSGDACQDLQNCKLLYIDLQKKTPSLVDFDNDSLEKDLQQIINDPHSDRLVLEMACKVYFLLLAKKYKQIDLKAVLHMESPRAYICRGILSTNKDFLNHELLYGIIITSLETCLSENSVHTTVALNNLRLFCYNYKNYSYDYPLMWRLVALHLSSRFIGAREEAMHILEFIVKFDCKYGMEIARMVIEEWPWTCANKFYVLRAVLEASPTIPNLLSSLHLDVDDLVDGLIMALKYRSLYTPGQLLFRSLLRKDELEVVIKFTQELIAQQDQKLLHTFCVQWSKEISNNKEEIFTGVQESLNSLNPEHNLMVVNVFRERLCEASPVLNTADPIIKQHYYDILIYRIGREFWTFVEDLTKLKEFLVDMKAEDNTTLRQYLFSTITNPLLALMKIYRTTLKAEIQEAIENFIKDLLQSIIIPGFETEDPNYPEIILSIRLYNILMKTLNPTAKNTNKSADLLDIVHFQNQLRDKRIFEGQSINFFKHLLSHINSAFDDIRELAVNLIVQYFPGTRERLKHLQEVFCEKMYFSSMDDSRRIHGYFQILVPYYQQLGLNLNNLYKEYRGHCLDNYQDHFRLDPLKSITGGIQLFDKINILREIVLAKCESPSEIFQLMHWLNEVATRMLHFLSLAQKYGEDEDLTPSFQVIDESLQILINNSGKAEEKDWDLTVDYTSMDLEENIRKRQDLLLSIWMTLKACGDLSATIIETTDCTVCPEIFPLAVEMNTGILHRCRHKGVIESIGLSFGRIVAHVSSSREYMSLYNQLDSCLKVLFESISASSYSRRGAGFPFLILNLIKNDRQPGRPFLKKAMSHIFQELSEESRLISIHGACLHYLSVLFMDSSLTHDMLPYLNDIITLCLEKIESPEWNVRNAALRLFGALVPKIIGQRQHSETEWEPCQCTLQELQATMPKIVAFVEFCLGNHRKISKTLLIAVLSFLSNVEYREISTTRETRESIIDEYLFHLMGHPVEKVRALAALCFARLQKHNGSMEVMVKLTQAVLVVKDPNLQHGILMALIFTCQKAKLEHRRSWKAGDQQRIHQLLVTEMEKAKVRVENGNSDSGNRRVFCDYNQVYLDRLLAALTN